MRMGPHSAWPRGAGAFAAVICALAALLSIPAGALASARLHPTTAATKGEAARVARYWTPARMRSTPPLDGPHAAGVIALASFAHIAEPAVPPYSVNGRLFVRQGKGRGFCSATAIDTPSRQLVLTAGHCVNTGPEPPNGHAVWSSFLEFIPAYSGGVAPFGAFVAHRKSVFALKQWTEFGNPNFDVGALVVSPNAEGIDVADAVGGGAALATDLSRRQDFQTFGYPGSSRWMQGCESPYVGDDVLTYRIPGPPTIAIGCHWVPGASGGGWLIEEGTAIDGLTSYGKRGDRRHTFSPYFSKRNVGRLTAGL
jgi:V8-like Glu-specific endopeptidase